MNITFLNYKRIFILLIFSLISSSVYAGKDHFHATESDNENVRNKALTSKMWWNNKVKIKTIELTENQRHDMDHILGDYLKKFTKFTKSEKDSFSNLNKALLSNNKEAAKVHRNKISKTIFDSLNEQIDVMINVNNVLTQKQRTIIQEKHPKLMSRLWIKAANPASLMQGRTERKRLKGKGKVKK